MRIALLASRRLRHGPMSPLLRFARDFMPFLEKHEIVTTDGCYRAFIRSGLFWSHPKLRSVGAGYQGALVRITSGVVPGAGDLSLDTVIYLVDPRDPSSNYPETNALKRECVVHKKPFLATSRSARLWALLNWRDNFGDSLDKHTVDHSTLLAAPGLAPPLRTQTVALIAHDNKKTAMLKFACDYFHFLIEFKERVGTGTTGELLNGRRPERIDDAAWEELQELCATLKEKIASAKREKLLASDKEFVQPLRSGPDGGDVQIASMVLDDKCQAIVFFEDPSIARQHEQDIQLLERTGRTRGKDVICVHDPTTAADLAQKWLPLSSRDCAEPLLVTTALERRFHVKAVLVEGGESTWRQILEAAAWHVLSQVAALAADRKKQGEKVRVTVSWGVGLSELARALGKHRLNLEKEDAKLRGRLHVSNLADVRYFRPVNVEVGPLQGIMAAADDAVEANAIASAIAKEFGGDSVELSLAALMQQDATRGVIPRREVPQAVMDHWDRTDMVVTTCAPVRKEYAGQVRAPDFDFHFRQVETASCGDVGGIYLMRDGRRFDPDRFGRIGMSEDQIRSVRERGGQTVLIAGAQPEREEITFASLESGLISLLISDLEFAKRLLRRAPSRRP